MTLRPFVAAVGLLGALAGPVASQESGSYSLVLPGVEFSACVQFLMEPEAASKEVGRDFVPVPAVNFTPLSPVLQREVQGDALHSAWIPAQICVIEAPTVSAGGRIITPEKKMGPRQVLGFWLIAAGRSEGTPRRDQWMQVALWTNDWHVQRATEAAFVPMSTFDPSLEPVPESNRHSYEIRVGKTYLHWDGELVGRDSTDAPRSTDLQLTFDGKRGIQWEGRLSAQTRWSRFLPGAFRVEGKDDLAEALKGSPIRMFGPMYWGGDARVDYVRYAPSGGS